VTRIRKSATLAIAGLSCLSLVAACGSSSGSSATGTSAAATTTSAAAAATSAATSASAPAATSAPAPAASASGAAPSAAPSTAPAENLAPASITVAIDSGLQPDAKKAIDTQISQFEAKYPTIKAKTVEYTWTGTTFAAKLAGGTLPTVFTVPFTDGRGLIARKQVADVSAEIAKLPYGDKFNPSVAVEGEDASGKLEAVPISAYGQALHYNRDLFTKAGLDPNTPPATWSDVIADAKKISALGGGVVGYADYSAGNTGGWHFTAEMYSQGGDITADGKTADYNNAKGLAVLNNLHQMRWVDNDMGTKQLLQYDDLNQMMSSGKLGMHIGAPDQVKRDHDNFKADYSKLGMGPMPGGNSTLLGGDGYLFNVKDTPDQVKAGLLWLEFEKLTPGQGQFNYARASSEKQAVGLPEPSIWTGAFADADNAAKDKYRTIPAANFAPYVTGTPLLKGNVEPPNAQAIYADLDKVMSEVLTNKNADIPGLLKTHAAATTKLLALATP
jgi:multiple sugar transport system substrate-binding protein